MLQLKRLLRTLGFGLMLLAGPGASYADSSLTSDVQVGLSANPSRNLKTGDAVDFTMTITNNGPQTLGYFSITGPEIFTEFYQPSANWNDCAMLTDTGDSDFGPFWLLVWFPSGLLSDNPVVPGESRVCHFTLTVAPGLPSRYAFTVELGTYFTDTNASNNSATVSLQRAAVPIPSGSNFSLAALSLLILGTACLRLFATIGVKQGARKSVTIDIT